MSEERVEGSTVAKAESMLITLGDQAEGCGVYGCTLELEEHTPLKEGDTESWHYDRSTGVHWPVLTEESEAELAAEEARDRAERASIEELNRQREQIQHRLTRLQQHRSRWKLSLEDVYFIHRMMGQATAFSGDFKPVD